MSLEMPQELDARESILFLGSGFSRSAKNLLGQPLPTSSELHSHFSDLLGVAPSDYDIKNLADEIEYRPGVNLYQTLYHLFTVQELHDDQKTILELPWKRIYTTNYDDAVELSYIENRNDAPIFNYDDSKPNRIPVGSVVHLHGAIRCTTEENVLQQLILNESSYVRQHFEKSPWYDEFIRDLLFCVACYFVGYNLSDYHISALLMQNHNTREKTYFVTQRTPGQIYYNRVMPYGTVLPIEAEGFAGLCRNLPKPAYINSPHALKAFRYQDPFIDRRTLSPPTASEILNLVTYGTFNFQRVLATLPSGEYVVPRQRLAEEAAARLRDARCLLVHGRIGNGKTIFLHILSHLLSQQGYRCFFARNDPPFLQRDVELLKGLGKVAIFFDSYNTAVTFVSQLVDLPSEARFVVAIRTSVQEVRLHEIRTRLADPLDRIDLNGIQEEDISAFRRLLGKAGLGSSDRERIIRGSKDFRDVVVGLYENAYIKEKIKSEFSPLLEDREFRNVFIVSHLLKWIGHDVDAAFLRSVTQSDAYAAIAKSREVAGDIFALDDDNIWVRSAILSEHLIQHHMKTLDIVECVYAIVVEAVKRKRQGGITKES